MTDSIESKSPQPSENNDKPKYHFDRLRMYFGEPYIIDKEYCHIKINQPTLGDILEIGENRFYSTLHVFVSNPTQYRVQLWGIGIDWNKISDYELFSMLLKTADPEVCRLLFGDLDFSNLNPYEVKAKDDEENANLSLFDLDKGFELSEETYMEMREYLRLMFTINPKVEKAKGKTTKEWMIEEERNKLIVESKKDTSSTLLPMVSFCVNHPGFKYRTSELKEIGIVQFMDSVQRLQVYENTKAINLGRFCGMADLSKIPTEQFNFMRDVEI